MKTLATLALALFASTAQAQPPVPHWPEDFKYVGSTTLPTPPAGNGDSTFGKGLSVVLEADKSFSLYTGSWNPQVILKWSVTRAADGSFAGAAAFKSNLGTAPIHYFLYGIHYDLLTGAFYFSSQNDYDTNPATDVSLGRATIDQVTGKLVSSGTFTFAARSDKMTQGGLTDVPGWFQKLHPCGRFLAGWGGYWSIIAIGPASMGAAATCFDPPDMSVTTGAIANTPVLGYAFSSSLTVHTPAAERNTNYNQRYGWGWWPATVTTGPGWWVPGDSLWQGCTWVDTPAVSGLVCVPMLHEGCNFYGSNALPPTLPVCAPYPGKAASLNSERARHWVFIYDPRALGAVADRLTPQNGIQAVQRAVLELPGVPQPLGGWPGIARMVTGVTFEPTSGLLAVMIRNTSVTGGRPVIFWYQVRRTQPYTFTATATVEAGSAAEALALVQAQAAQWTLKP